MALNNICVQTFDVFLLITWSYTYGPYLNISPHLKFQLGVQFLHNVSPEVEETLFVGWTVVLGSSERRYIHDMADVARRFPR